jgi:dolichyl-phosphate-mannose--protein O-mannosyl transferase
MAWNNRKSHEGPEVERRMAAVILTGVTLGFLLSFVYVFFIAPVR